VIVHDSALKHGIKPVDSVFAAEHWEYRSAERDEDPLAEFRLGFDP